ncbi:putative 4-hydroxybenzoate polyprenyl transferase [Hypoxylon fragiforme]|uniref:putative 4-hydroxybenzoate polyprenyl transferase n=1 Tax=Hypoxylon fragiforme TaxID=63214 RepID=UPI0020C5D33B|nr:putative 4-hydroxybenzoate polyprenyl transferase [Hypoxylon fragiforme]KAI2605354.1 putative 4-hydroxybenzoate polyprenyl transferase [Hypoxylon fragiforme]
MPTTAPSSKSPTGIPSSETNDQNFFPHLPPYSDPTSGFLSHIPRSWIPYAQLMRLEKPAGLYGVYFPHLISLLYASCLPSHSAPPSPLSLLKLAAALLPFNILLRGASCTWNDTADQAFDRRVARTRHRPVARGAVSTTRANVFTAAQLALLFAYHQHSGLLPAAETATFAVFVTALFLAYALMKRVTDYPQVVLGVGIGAAVFFATAALGVDLDSRVGGLGLGLGLGGGEVSVRAPTLALFGAIMAWTITYDTIYAHQDVVDDLRAGVKSMALRFRESTKALAGVLSAVQVLLLALCGYWAGLGPVYFVGTVGGVAVAMAYYLYDVDLKNPESCGMWFHRQFWIVGAAFMAGFAGEYALRLAGSES